jgi:hypothetical protein
MLLEAPLNFDLLVRPRLAAKAAPAAICCFFDFAGMLQPTHAIPNSATGTYPPSLNNPGTYKMAKAEAR